MEITLADGGTQESGLPHCLHSHSAAGPSWWPRSHKFNEGERQQGLRDVEFLHVWLPVSQNWEDSLQHCVPGQGPGVTRVGNRSPTSYPPLRQRVKLISALPQFTEVLVSILSL